MNNTKFKQTEIGKIPENWEIEELSELSDFQYGLGEIAKDNGNCVYLRITDVNNDGTLDKTNLKYIDFNLKDKKYILNYGDILVARTGATFGKTYMFKEKMNATFGGFLIRLILNSKIDNRFLFQFMRSTNYWNQANNLVNGDAQPQFNANTLSKLIIPLPPLPEQKAIAKILSDLDSKIELNQQMNKTLEEIGKTLFKRWFVDFEFPNEQGKPYKSSGGEMVYNEELKKEIPKGWNVKPLKELVLLNKRGIPPKYVSDGVPVLNQRCIRDKIIFNDPSIQYHDSKKSINSELYLKSFDILINSMGVGTLGRISQASVVDNQYLVHSCITIIRADPQKISPFLLGYYFKDIQPMIEDLGEGSTGQTSLDNKKLDNLLVVVPDKEIQDRLDILFNSIILETGKLDSENIKLAETRDSLLPKLMSGKIRVKY